MKWMHIMATAAPAKLNPRDRWLKRIPILLIFAFLSYRFIAIFDFKAPKQIDVVTLNLETLGGNPIPPAKLQGKAILLNYWAPWCGPCRTEIPWLRQLQAEHPTDLVVIGVIADPSDYVQAALFMKDIGVAYPLAKVSPSLQAKVGTVAGLPTSFYIAPSGSVVHTVSGVIPETLMKRYLGDALP